MNMYKHADIHACILHYVHLYVHIYVCVCICSYIYIDVYVRQYAHMYLHVCNAYSAYLPAGPSNLRREATELPTRKFTRHKGIVPCAEGGIPSPHPVRLDFEGF